MNNLKIVVGTIIFSTVIYFSLIIILRISGKRTLSEINGLDLLVPVAIGPISATTILSKDITLMNGLVAIITLMGLQYIITKLETKYIFIEKILIPSPTLLYYKEEYLIENMNKMRITKHDINQQVRLKAGLLIGSVDAVLLESNGEISVIIYQNEKDIEKLKKYK